MNNSTHPFRTYSAWRANVLRSIEKYSQYLEGNNLSNKESRARINALLDFFNQDSFSVAVISNVPNEKNALINAIFFKNSNDALMPTENVHELPFVLELLYNKKHSPSLRLLPVTRDAQSESSWVVYSIDSKTKNSFSDLFKLLDSESYDAKIKRNNHDEEKEPHWQRAIINFPNIPMRDGLHIIDITNPLLLHSQQRILNSLLNKAIAIIFVLDPETELPRKVIDAMENFESTPDLKFITIPVVEESTDDDEAFTHEERFLHLAHTLHVDKNNIFTLQKSEENAKKENPWESFEKAFFLKTIEQKKKMFRTKVETVLEEISEILRAQLMAKTHGSLTQLNELKRLRMKHFNTLENVRVEMGEEKTIARAKINKLQVVHNNYTRMVAEVFDLLKPETINNVILQTRNALNNDLLPNAIIEILDNFFKKAHEDLENCAQKINEISSMMQSNYDRFKKEFNLPEPSIMPFSIEKYQNDTRKIEDLYRRQFDTFSLLMASRTTLIKRFLDQVSPRIRKTYSQVNNDIEAWLRLTIAPLDTFIKEHKEQIRKREYSYKRMIESFNQLEDTINALGQTKNKIEEQRARINFFETDIRKSMDEEIPQKNETIYDDET